MKTRMKIAIGITVLLAVVMAGFMIRMEFLKEDDAMKVGFIMSGFTDDEGWNGMHYTGVKEACEELGVELIVKENVQEFKGECTTAVKELVKEKADIIILSSYNYSEEVKDVIKKYPKIAFYCNSSEYHDDNMSSYFVRYYQGRYLSGVLAGMETKSDKIGYVAAMANNEVNRGINAFTLGVKSVNKDADVYVAWTENWEDEVNEKKLTNMLIEDKKVDVITYHQNKSYVIEAADKKDVKSIGYHEVFKGFSDNYMTSLVCDWKLVYKEMVQECLQGHANSKANFWIGMEKNVVELSTFSDIVSKDAIKKVEEAKFNITNGKDVFSDVIYDTKGKKRCDKDETITDDILLEHMDWYVEGVKIYEN